MNQGRFRIAHFFGGWKAVVPLALLLLVGVLAGVRFLRPGGASTAQAPVNAAEQSRAATANPFTYPAASRVAVPRPDPQAVARAVVADSRQPCDARARALKTVVDGRTGVDFDAVLWTFQNDATFAPRYLLVKAMADLGDGRAVPHLLGALKDGADVEARRIAARALEPYIEVGGVEEALHEAATSDGDRFVRQNAVRTLVALPPANARWRLEELLKTEKDATVKALIENALAGLDVR